MQTCPEQAGCGPCGGPCGPAPAISRANAPLPALVLDPASACRHQLTQYRWAVQHIVRSLHRVYTSQQQACKACRCMVWDTLQHAMLWTVPGFASRHVMGGNRHLGLTVRLVVGNIVGIAVSCRLSLHGRLSIQRGLQQDVLQN